MDENIIKIEKKKLSRYFSDLQFRLAMYEKAKRETNVYLASDFNVFKYINPNENKISDIISDLLNPNGEHGQKETFLKKFLGMISIENNIDLINCKIKREDSTSYIENSLRRIDITINFDNKFEIGIENKPWDKEQENQLQDYEKHLRKRYGSNYCIIYISGSGLGPESLTNDLKDKLLKEKKLFVLTYDIHIKKWLEECYKECEAEKIRIFIKDFISYIDNNFKSLNDDMGEEVNE